MSKHPRSTFYGRYGKRLFDAYVATLLLIVAAPIMLAVAGLVAVFLGRPVLFKQKRPGKHGRIFTMYKFRTMTDARDANGELLPDDQRLTKFGKFLRASSLDELPELINIVRGDMSLIGPRPLLVSYLPKYSEYQARRHETLPGITGWAQVNGRNGVPWDERLAMDVWYVDHCSFSFDLWILWKTVETVVRRDGIAAEGHATMPAFGEESPSTTSRAA